jgi:hypothetical protein
VFDDLSVRDNLTLMRPDRDLAPFVDYFARFPILPRRLEQHAGTLSGGEKKLLSLTRGLGDGPGPRRAGRPARRNRARSAAYTSACVSAVLLRVPRC